MSTRPSISKARRFAIFARDQLACRYCGRKAPDVTLELDHAIPVAQGGSHFDDNLVTSCFDCNRGKHDRVLAWVPVTASGISLEQREADLQAARAAMQAHHEQRAASLAAVLAVWEAETKGWRLNDEGSDSLAKAIERYGVDEVIECARISCRQYLEWINGVATRESVEEAHEFIRRICATRVRDRLDPDLRRLTYIRKILINRLDYVDARNVMHWMRQAKDEGMEFDEIEHIAATCYSCRNFGIELGVLDADAA